MGLSENVMIMPIRNKGWAKMEAVGMKGRDRIKR